MDINRLINDDGVADHTALLPTKKKNQVNIDKYNDKERLILELLYQNLEEAASEPYRYEKTSVTLSCGGHLFTAIGVRNLELGWKKNRPNEVKENILPEFEIGDRVAIEDVFIEKRQTEPPERFTDGKLLKAMEKAGESSAECDAINTGIGTSATRADIIEKLVSGGFVKRVGEEGQPKVFKPTELAYLLYGVLPDSLKSSELTAEWEVKLSEVEKGTLDPKTFLEQIKAFIQISLDMRETNGYVLASKLLVDKKLKVGFMYREAPDDAFDSGWRFFCGNESDEYVNDSENIGLYSIETISQIDPDIIPLLSNDIGTAFERESGLKPFRVSV